MTTDFDAIWEAFYPLVTFLCGVALGIAFGHSAGERRGILRGIRAARRERENGWRK